MFSVSSGAGSAPALSTTEPENRSHTAGEASLPCSFDSLPAELQAGFLFCCWQYVPDKSRPDKLKKKPIIALTGKAARTNNPDHFTQLPYAVNALNDQSYNGMGRLMQCDLDFISAIDVDNCIDESGTLDEYARDLCDRAGSYAEITPSNRGIRIFVQSGLPAKLMKPKSVKIWNKGSHPDHPELEVQLFMRGQYVTVTGSQIAGTPNSVAANSAFISHLLRQNPAKVKKFFSSALHPVHVVGAPKATLDEKPVQLSDVSAPGTLNTRRTDSRIKTMRLNSIIFQKNWQLRADKPGKTNSEYQFDLVDWAVLQYQMDLAEIRYMLQHWCRKHNINFQEHRLKSWLEDAYQNYQDALLRGWMSRKDWETQRKRDQRARNKLANIASASTVVGVNGKADLEYGQLKRQILTLAADGKSQNQIAEIVGRSRSMVANTLLRDRNATSAVLQHTPEQGAERGGREVSTTRKQESKRTPTLDSPAGQLLHDLLLEVGRPLRPMTADSIIADVETYAIQVGYQGSITEEMIQRAVSQPLAPKRQTSTRNERKPNRRVWFVKVLQEVIAERIYLDDQILLDLVCLIHEHGLPSNQFNSNGSIRRIKMGPATAVLRAKQALSILGSYPIPCDFVLNAETVWRYSEKHGGLRIGVKHLAREQEDRLFLPTTRQETQSAICSDIEESLFTSFEGESRAAALRPPLTSQNSCALLSSL